jgi:predicted nucleic-acid-binding protein
MGIAIDTNVLVRILIPDPTAPDQCAAARRLVAEASAAGEPLIVSLCALLETERVLRSRYQVDRQAMATAFISMLETPGIEFEHDPAVEEAHYLLDRFPSADFADCLRAARATHLGCSRFLTFDAAAARLPRGELLQQATSP